MNPARGEESQTGTVRVDNGDLRVTMRGAVAEPLDEDDLVAAPAASSSRREREREQAAERDKANPFREPFLALTSDHILAREASSGIRVVPDAQGSFPNTGPSEVALALP